MFLLWIACIFQVIISLDCENQSMSETKNKYKQSMQQVGTILSEIEHKIKHERQLLHHLAINPGISADNTSQWLANVSGSLDKIARNRFPKHRIHFRDGMGDVSLNQLIDVRQATTMGINPFYYESLRKQVGDVDDPFEENKDISKPQMDLPPDDVNDESLAEDWRRDLDVYVEEDTAQVMLNKKKNEGPNKIPLITKLNILMAEQGVGYSYAAVIGFSDTILERDSDDLKILIDIFSKSVVRISNGGKLNSLGNLFANRVKLLRVWSSMSSVSSVQEIAEKARQALLDKNLDDDFVKIFTTYDSLFTPDEGQYLLEKLAAINEVNIKTGDHSILSFLMDNLIEAFIAPADRLHNSMELKSLIEMINKSYLERFPDFRRSEIDTLVNTIDEFELNKTQKSAETRRLSRSDVKFGWRKLLRHLIVKHPKLLRKFIDHFKRSRKNHHANHHKNIGRKHKHNKKSTAESKKTKTHNGKDDHQGSARSHSRKNYKLNARSHTHTTDSTSFRRMDYDTAKVHKDKSKKNNKLLQKILADSSYSDEETELKTMLADALFSWNGTGHKKSKSAYVTSRD